MLFHAKYQSNSPEQAGVPRRGRRPLPAGSDRSAAPGWVCSGNAVARPRAPGGIGPPRQCPGLRVQSQPAANPPPLPPALKDVVLFLPRTKDNKGSRGATHRVEARPQAPSARSSSRVQDGSPAAACRPRREAASRPRAHYQHRRCRCRSGATGVVGPASPGAPAASSRIRARPPRSPRTLRDAGVALPAQR